MMRYLKGTLDYGLRYRLDGEVRLHGFIDSYWAGSDKDRKSTSGCCFSLGSGMISWFSRKQTSITLSTAEAEYMLLVQLVVKQYGFERCWQVYLMKR